MHCASFYCCYVKLRASCRLRRVTGSALSAVTYVVPVEETCSPKHRWPASVVGNYRQSLRPWGHPTSTSPSTNHRQWHWKSRSLDSVVHLNSTVTEINSRYPNKHLNRCLHRQFISVQNVAIWLSGNALAAMNKLLYPGSVNTWMGDCLRPGMSPRYAANHPGQLVLSSPWRT